MMFCVMNRLKYVSVNDIICVYHSSKLSLVLVCHMTVQSQYLKTHGHK